MTLIQRSLNLFACCVLALSSSACGAQDDPAQPKSPAQPRTAASKPASAVSAEQIRAALRSPDERVFETLLGTLIIKRSGNSTRTPGKIFLNDELIYTARSDGAYPDPEGVPFNLSEVDFDTNNKRPPDYRVTKMVVKEGSYTCQYIVLDFTGPKVWISKRFPEGFQRGECLEMTWVRWIKLGAYFYFGASYHDWDKDGYRGHIEGYNSKLKAVFANVDAPPPPKDASLVPHRLDSLRQLPPGVKFR